MPTKVRCPGCPARLTVPDHLVGKTVRCPRCKSMVPSAAITALVGGARPPEGVPGRSAPHAPVVYPVAGPGPVVPREARPSLEAVPVAALMTAEAPLALPVGDEPEAELPVASELAEAVPVESQEATGRLDWSAPAAPEALQPRTRRKRREGVGGFSPARVVFRTLAICLVAGLGLGLAVLLGWGVTKGLRAPPPPAIPPEQWQALEVPNRVKILLPGHAQRQTQAAEGMVMVMYLYEPTKDSAYGIGYSEGTLPAHRRHVPSGVVLSDACDGAMAKWRGMGAREESREPVQLGPYPGMQLVAAISRVRGKFISRVYLANGRLYMVLAGGVGLEPEHENVQRLFNSLEILDTGAPPPPPVVRKPDPPTKPPERPEPPPGRPAEPRSPRRGGGEKPQPEPPPGIVGEVVLPDRGAGGVMALGYSLDGKTLAIGTRSGRAFWYDADSRKPLASTSRQSSSVRDLSASAVSPQADKVAFIKHGGLLYFVERGDPPDEVIIRPEESRGIANWKVAFSPDGKHLCTTHGDRVSRVWDVEGRRLARELKGFKQQVGSTAYAPDGSLLACADTDVFLWDPKTYELRGKLPGPGQFFFSALAFSANGKQLAGAHDRTIYLWELENDPDGQVTPSKSREIHHFGRVQAITFSPDGELLLAATDDGNVRLTDAQTLKRHGDLPNGGVLAFRATDGQLAVGRGDRIVLYDLRRLNLR